MSEEQPLPYREVSDPTYAAAFLDGPFTWDVTDGMLVLRGWCPRCAVAIEAAFPDELVRSGGTSPEPGTHQDKLTLVCTCRCDHPQRPPEVQEGCGAYWALSLTSDAP